jgi:hypothetical protein
MSERRRARRPAAAFAWMRSSPTARTRCSQRTRSEPLRAASTRARAGRRTSVIAGLLLSAPLGEKRKLTTAFTSTSGTAVRSMESTYSTAARARAREAREDLLPGPKHPSPAPLGRRRHSDDQLPALERAQRDIQRSRGELELGRELRGRDGARMAGCDDVERRLLALREVIGEVAVQRSRP